jgi:hypothetical protein
MFEVTDESTELMARRFSVHQNFSLERSSSMRKWNVIPVFMAIFALTLLTPPTIAQEKQEMTPEQMVMMEAWAKASTPNENHQRLAQFEGSWNFTSRWWSSPGAPTQESSGTATYEMTMDGRYLKETVKSQMRDEQFEGLGYTGYDNMKKSYVWIWMDNMSTGFLVSEGSWDEKNKTFTSTGEYIDVITGKLKTMRAVSKVVSHDKHVGEFFDTDADGKEYKSMELIYTRQ